MLIGHLKRVREEEPDGRQSSYCVEKPLGEERKELEDPCKEAPWLVCVCVRVGSKCVRAVRMRQAIVWVGECKAWEI